MSERLLHFVETSISTKRIGKLASREVLLDLQDDLLVNPERGDIITGTGGARKARAGDKSRNRGKSGAFRYIYVYFESVGYIYLLLFFGKNEQADLNDDQRKYVAEFIRTARKNLLVPFLVRKYAIIEK